MLPVLAFRHVPHEPLGLLEDAFRQAGLVYSYIDLFDEVPRHLNLEQVAGVVVLILIMAFQGEVYPFGPAGADGNCP